jgi:predicted dienelactone hydrolase
MPESVYLAQLQSATTFDAETRVREIKVETLILAGDADIVLPRQNSRDLTGSMPNAKLEIIENGSHMFFIEKAEIKIVIKQIPFGKTHTIMHKCGYTGSVYVPMVLDDAIRGGKLKRGETVIRCASGGGLI